MGNNQNGSGGGIHIGGHIDQISTVTLEMVELKNNGASEVSAESN